MIVKRNGIKPRWSLITVTYNNAETLRKFWERFQIPADVEWIVVDNYSTDESARVARELGARVLELRDNRGFGTANNIGFDVSEGTYVAFVNPDVSVDTSSLDVLGAILKEQDALVAPQLMNSDGSFQPNGRGWPYLAHKILNRISPDKVSEEYTKVSYDGSTVPVPWVIGAVVAGRRETLRRLGPWDKKFFLYYEDKDICLRARRLGVPTLLIGSVKWTHGWARETSSFRLQPWLHELASMRKFYSRYPRYLSPMPAFRAMTSVRGKQQS